MPRMCVRIALAVAACCALLTAAEKNQRAEAWSALRTRLTEAKYLKHSLAVEASMREMATARGEDVTEWGLAGLLHDIDLGETAADPSRHGIAGAQILHDLGLSDAVVHAVKSHDDRAGVARTNRMDKALYCADQVYWLIMAAGLEFPSDKLNAADPGAVLKQVQEIPAKRDAVAKLSRECPDIGLSLPGLFEVSLTALKRLSSSRPLTALEEP
jgi:putative nucleotidyltransferase with HDIG domain